MTSSSSASFLVILSSLLVVFIHGVNGADVIKAACEQVANRKASARCIRYFTSLPKIKTQNTDVLTETAIRSTLDLAIKMEDALQVDMKSHEEKDACLTAYQTANGAIQNALMSFISKDFAEAKASIMEASAAPEICQPLFAGEDRKTHTSARVNMAFRHFIRISEYIIKSYES